MPRRRDEYEEDDEQDEEEYDAVDEEDEEDYDDGGKTKRKRGRSDFIDDYAEEDDEEEEDDDDEDYGGGASARGGKRHRKAASEFFDEEAAVDSDEDEEEEEGEDDFIDTGADIPDEDDRRIHRRPLLPREDEQEDVEEIERRIQERYAKSLNVEYDEEATDVEQQALLPSVRDPKLWMVKCAIGREREVAVCLMQKSIDKGPEMQIRSVIALDHLKNYIYIEADKEAHVREARADTWVRMKIGIYKGDLAKEGREVPKKKAFTPPARFMNIDEARELHIRVERRRDQATGDYFEKIEGMMFKDGFLYKNVSLKSLSTQNVQPTFDELEKFRHPGETGDGDLRNLKGWVEKVEEDTVHIKPNEKGLPKTLAISDKELCKYFEPGNHVKVVSGATEGATGMVVSVEGHVLRVFADNVVESSEVTSGVTRIGDYELHDLVLLDDNSFGVIIRVESEAFQVLKGVPDRPDVALVRLREIKYKIDKKIFAKDRYKNTLSVKDVVKILDGPCRGNAMTSRFSHLRTPPRVPQSPMRPPRGGPMNCKSVMIVFTQLFHYIVLNWIVGGRHGGGRGHDALVGAVVKIRLGHYKGCKGRVKDVKGAMVRVELESQMKVVAGKETSRYGMGSETPMHPSRTPLHPYMTPMRDSFATPHHDGMRTPMRDRAWNPYTPMSPPRDNWEDANPASWGTSPQYQPGSPPSRAYERRRLVLVGRILQVATMKQERREIAVLPMVTNAPSPYLPSTPGGQPPMTPSSAYLPGTPGGQPMTPGSGGLDMSPVVGADNEGPWLLPDILVSVRRSGEESSTGVIKEVLPDGSCKIALGSSGNGETVTALQSEIEIVAPRKAEKIKIMGGAHRGATGKLIGIDGTDGIVKVDDTLDVKILDMVILAKLVQT
ncbi:hypothetical protein DH2020_007261 [Rehmannia glutinosa]|uniref:KOW domain-containing protein n=1 Tax=Rehmannia glutinosa TaxID=99300 RepID=A0ABR0TXY8_REHGL